jgi:thiamine-phosphate pyrophosphorylase
MKITVLSPPGADVRETPVVSALFEAGLETFHLRKPGWTLPELAAWGETLPSEWRSRVVLHAAAGTPVAAWMEAARRLGLRGLHFRFGASPPDLEVVRAAGPGLQFGRACHDLAELGAALGRFDRVLAGPVFASISKPGHGPDGRLAHEPLRHLLAPRTSMRQRTEVFALGGVDKGRIEACRALGFDGAAVLGAVWNARDPVAAFTTLRDAAERSGVATEQACVDFP